MYIPFPSLVLLLLDRVASLSSKCASVYFMQKFRADYKTQELFTKDFKTTEMSNYYASHYYDLCEGINLYRLAWTFWAS